MAVSFRDVLERRVPQYLAIYLGVGWGLVEFMSLLEERFSWSPVWTNLVLFTFALMIPSVLLFTWFHGRPGRDRWARAELIGIPLNAVLALSVLGTAFGGADLSATTVKVTVTDEAGNEVERRIANASYRKRLAVFHFDAPQGDTANAWLGEGAALALVTDLAQDLFLDMRMPAHFREQLSEAGFADGRNVPFQLKQKIAEEAHLPYFLSGSVSSGVEGITVRVGTYETATGKLIRERVSTATDVFRAIDELSVQIKQDLGLPQARPDGMKDLPVAELLSPVPGAFRGVVEGQAAFTRSDWAGAQRGFARAVQLDSSFALAHYALYQSRLVANDAAGSVASLDAAMRNMYRLPERTQFLVKADHYFMQRDMEKAFAVVNMMVELYPDDLQGHLLRAQFLILRDERQEAIAALKRVLELDPQQHEMLLQIGSLQMKTGAFDDALATYRDYARRFPNDVAAQLRVARTQVRAGRLAEAGTFIDRALLIDPTNVEAMVENALILRNRGELDRAERQLESALAAARTAEDRARAYSGMQSLYDFGGRLARSIDALEKRAAAVAEFTPPMQAVAQRMNQVGLYVRAGLTGRANALIDNARASLSAPLDDFWHLGQLEYGIAARDTLLIAEGVAGVQRIIDSLGYRFLEAQVTRASAVRNEIRGDWNGALRDWQQYQTLEPEEANVRRDIARALRHLGRNADAIALLEEHLGTVPASPETNLESARVRLAMGDTAAARTHLERALAILAGADAGYDPAREAARLLDSIR